MTAVVPLGMAQMWHGHGADLTALTGHMTIASRWPSELRRHTCTVKTQAGFPARCLSSAASGPGVPIPRRDPRIVALIVGLGVAAALLWLGIALFLGAQHARGEGAIAIAITH